MCINNLTFFQLSKDQKDRFFHKQNKKDFINSNNLTFLQLAKDQKENFVFSPLSLHIALSMLAHGASKLTDTR
jgi:serine protease inhibitor